MQNKKFKEFWNDKYFGSLAFKIKDKCVLIFWDLKGNCHEITNTDVGVFESLDNDKVLKIIDDILTEEEKMYQGVLEEHITAG